MYSGTIEKVTVTVNNLTHPYAPDVGLLLVGPNNKAVVLMSGSGGNSGGNAALNNATFTFSDDASAGLPVNSPLVSGTTYKPTDNGALTFTAPAPVSGYVKVSPTLLPTARRTASGAYTSSTPPQARPPASPLPLAPGRLIFILPPLLRLSPMPRLLNQPRTN